MKFNKRTTKPSSSDKNYRRYDQGGHNYCIHIRNGSVLPNCVGYAWGRWRELLGKFHELSRGNAEVWYGKNDGYERSKAPRLGSVICWSQGDIYSGRDGMGHVAIVEEIYSDGSILTSNSAYGGSEFYMRKIKPPYNIGSNFKFQGFIHLPVKMEVEKPSTNKKSNQEIAKEVLAGKWGNGQARKDALTKAGYNYNAIQDIVNGKPAAPAKKSNETIAKEVLAGKWGNGQERINRLTAAGYNHVTIQNIVNKGSAKSKKSNAQIAKEVANGDWGNGQDRVNRLTKAGYDYNAIQAIVNKR